MTDEPTPNKKIQLPSDFLASGLENLGLKHYQAKAMDKWQHRVDYIFKRYQPAKPSLVMAAFTYLRLKPDFDVRLGQTEICTAFIVSNAALRSTVRKIAKRVVRHTWRGG